MRVTEQGIDFVRQFCTKYPFIPGQFSVFKDYCLGAVADTDFRDNLRFIKGIITISNPKHSDSLAVDLNILSSYFEEGLSGSMIKIAEGMPNVVGNEQDLVSRIKSSQTIVLVRAINDDELRQLVKDGTRFFLFNEGTKYQQGYFYQVKILAKERTGTIIVYPTNAINPIDISKFSNDGNNDNLKVRFYKCKESFQDAVEVYNIRDLTWEQLAKAKTPFTAVEEIKQGLGDLYHNFRRRFRKS